MKKYSFVFFISVLTICSACNRQVIQPGPTDLGFDYFPTEKGHFVIYDVDSIIYNDFNQTIDTTSLQFRDEVGDMYVDNAGDTTHIINRYRRYTSNQTWLPEHTFYVKKNSFRLEWQEDNLRFIKMTYPVKVNGKWFGNSYLSTLTNSAIRWYDNWEYRYTEVSQPFNTGVKTYPKTHTIFQSSNIEPEGNPQDPASFSAYSYGQEVYAQNVGMVFKELTRWEYQPSSASPFRKGFTLIMRARSNN